MFARVHTLASDPEGHDRGLELLQGVLPWLQDSRGFRGLLRLSTTDRAKTIVVTFWTDEAAMLETSEASREFGALIAETAGTTVVALEDYEVTYLDLADD
jgi:heme-degrading monooxygenase HmoA